METTARTLPGTSVSIILSKGSERSVAKLWRSETRVVSS